MTTKLSLITTAFNGTEIRALNHPERGMLMHATDVLLLLGYSARVGGAGGYLRDLGVPKSEWVLITASMTMGNSHGPKLSTGRATFLTRAGVHQLLMASAKPAAKEFREWLAGEVVVAIEDTGGYLLNEAARETAKADTRDTVPVPDVVAELTATLIAEKTARHQAEIALLIAQQWTLEA